MSLKHFKFEHLKSYDFKIVSEINEKSEYTVSDIESNIFYTVKKHFSSPSINIGSLKRFTYIGLDNRMRLN